MRASTLIILFVLCYAMQAAAQGLELSGGSGVCVLFGHADYYRGANLTAKQSSGLAFSDKTIQAIYHRNERIGIQMEWRRRSLPGFLSDLDSISIKGVANDFGIGFQQHRFDVNNWKVSWGLSVYYSQFWLESKEGGDRYDFLFRGGGLRGNIRLNYYFNSAPLGIYLRVGGDGRLYSLHSGAYNYKGVVLRGESMRLRVSGPEIECGVFVLIRGRKEKTEPLREQK